MYTIDYTIISNEVNGLSKIPDELKARPQWVVWRGEDRDGKPTKIPVNPKTGGNARADDPATWGDFSQALIYYEAHRGNGVAGIGFVFSADDPFTGVDLDKCRDLETGEIEPWAWDIINLLNSYAEISPSGRGVHILVKGKLPPGPRRRGKVEMYDCGRFFTVTGQHLEGTLTTIEDRQEMVEALHTQHFPQAMLACLHVTQELGPGPALSDQEILSLATQSDRFDNLWEGDWQDAGYASASEADLAICSILARHTQDPAQIDRLFRQSGLYREKWDRPDYPTSTIRKAMVRETQQTPIIERGVFKPITAADLLALDLPPTRWIIPELIPEGLIILAGRPKVGKSWLAMNLGLAVTGIGKALGKIEVEDTGGCLYLALEDTLERLKNRIETLSPDTPPLSNLHLQRELKPLYQGGLSEVHEWLRQTPDIKIVILDTLSRVMPPVKRNQRLYSADVEVAAELQALAQDHHLAMIMVHHEKKLKDSGDHFVDLVSGTHGLAGTADAVLVLTTRNRSSADAILWATGRDLEEKELALKFSDGFWELLGDAQEFAFSQRQQDIIDLLTKSGPQTPSAVASTLNIPQGSAKSTLWRMAKEGVLTVGEGKYGIKKG